MPRQLPAGWHVRASSKQAAASPAPRSPASRSPAPSRRPTPTAQSTATPRAEPAKNTSSGTPRRSLGLSPSRSPSTSPPPGPLEERFMIEGADHDDRYRMVEDEFLAVAVQFTKHIHKAEYQRLKALAESQNADTIRDISRPVTGEMTADVKRRQTALGNAAKQRKALASVLGKRPAGNTSDSDDVGRPATSLQGLMKKKRPNPAPLTAVSSSARATVGLDAGPSRRVRPPSSSSASTTRLSRAAAAAAAAAAKGMRGRSSANGVPPLGRSMHRIPASNSDDEELIDLKREEILRIKQEPLTDSGDDDDDDDDDDLDNQVTWSPRYRHRQAPKKSKLSLPERSAQAKPPPKSDPRPSVSKPPASRTSSTRTKAPAAPSIIHLDTNSNPNGESEEEDLMASIRARIAARKQNHAHSKPQQKDKGKETPPRTTNSSESRKTSLDEIPFI